MSAMSAIRITSLVGALAVVALGASHTRKPEPCARTVVVERHDNGVVRRVAEYCDGQLDGKVRGWYENGAVMLVHHYRNGLSEGLQRQWYPTGRVFSMFNHHDGHELGRQQMWNPDGTIRSNYVIRDGKRYGLLGTMGCTGRSAGEAGVE